MWSRGWCVRDPEEGLILETVRRLKAEAIEAYLGFECGVEPGYEAAVWRECVKKKGVAAVKVWLRPVWEWEEIARRRRDE